MTGLVSDTDRAAAVEAGLANCAAWLSCETTIDQGRTIAQRVVAAAEPHLTAPWRAEVDALQDALRLDRELRRDWRGRAVRAEEAVARVRALHIEYLPNGVDFDCCAECNRGDNYVPWPCPTVVALNEGEKP